MKSLLLVGASGFLGQHIKSEYESNGWSVFTLGRNPDSDYCFNEKDLNSILEISYEVGFDRLIHAAAINEVDILKDLQKTYSVNVTLTRILIELARDIKISEFVYISTFHVYGVGHGEIDENSSVSPVNDYGLTHHLSEKIVTELGAQYGIVTLCVRPTNIYGEPVDLTVFNRWTLVPFAFPQSAINDSRITIKSSGNQLRNFVSVNDVIRSIEIIGKETMVNAYGNDTLTIREFALLVSSIVSKDFGQKCEVVWQEVDNTKVSTLSVINTFKEYAPNDYISSFIHSFLRMIKA